MQNRSDWKQISLCGRTIVCEDQQIRLLSQQTNVICQVCNVRLGISSKLAQTILVEPLLPQKKVA